jgi:hypothetical protein
MDNNETLRSTWDELIYLTIFFIGPDSVPTPGSTLFRLFNHSNYPSTSYGNIYLKVFFS